MGYGGYDMVKSTGETIVGVAKFAGRGVMQVGLRFTWAVNWITGQDNSAGKGQESILDRSISSSSPASGFLGSAPLPAGGMLRQLPPLPRMCPLSLGQHGSSRNAMNKP